MKARRLGRLPRPMPRHILVKHNRLLLLVVRISQFRHGHFALVLVYFVDHVVDLLKLGIWFDQNDVR